MAKTLEPRYIDKHPFMQLLYRGKLSKMQIQAWVINRFYLQNNIASKDAAIISNCPIPEVRRIWLSRMLRREGMGETVGDVDGWLDFAEAVGLDRRLVVKARCLPGVRFAVGGLVDFVRKGTWLEGVATSLYEIRAREELASRIRALKTRYEWIEPDGLKFFLSRLGRVDRDANAVVELVTSYADGNADLKSAALAALRMSEVIWSIHDAVYVNYVVADSRLSDSI